MADKEITKDFILLSIVCFAVGVTFGYLISFV